MLPVLPSELRSEPATGVIDAAMHSIEQTINHNRYFELAQRRAQTTYAQRMDMLRRLKEQQKLRLSADEKAGALLKSWLSPLQLEEYERHKAFYVKGNHTKRRYRITSDLSYNIWEMTRDGTVIDRFCLTINDFDRAPNYKVYPLADIMLALKIALETDEKRALKTAYAKRVHNIFKTIFLRLFANCL